ncbi:TetR/AcrR family transcriptional regulator [Streptomyces sp. PTM05]|uniref:TetR/AcrR family transcriptional regulator n=1 Tax=Streptantibioticus parmotrematis TaxID=2873249 RepID=A0ABS7QRK1_9ACTN|nr:TetR/AcrR family transcriptional regulator [Streptantibioticus parmotrematis]MBY8885816.1 TetR/AcrR family transcriptional regulator [Streptantibioticus parmotrematis]
MSARREEILDAGLAIADEKGLNAVSMRAVAERVGVTPMALYPHVGSKAALLDGMVGRLLGELAPAVGGEGLPWDERMRHFAHAARGLGRRHPWAAALLFARPSVTPDGVRTVDGVYTALLDAGVPERHVPRLERLLSTFVIGYAASEAGGRFGPGDLDPRARRGQLPEGTLPAHARLARHLDEPVDWDAEFEADLEDLRGLVRALAEDGRPKGHGEADG